MTGLPPASYAHAMAPRIVASRTITDAAFHAGRETRPVRVLTARAHVWAVAALLLLAVAAVLPALAQTLAPLDRSGSNNDAGTTRRVLIRFLTTTDFPPFNSLDDENQLGGLNVDLARALCLDLSVTCDVRTRPWDEMLTAIEQGEADALIAGHAITPSHLAKLDFTLSYFSMPGRFAVPVGAKTTISPEMLSGKRVAVARSTAHAAFLKDFFPRAEIIEVETPEHARDALIRKEVEAIFGDGVSLAFWLHGALSRGCCELAGGPYFEPRYFGSGLSIGVKKGDRELRAMLDGAIQRLRINGRLEELIQRHFPIRVY